MAKRQKRVRTAPFDAADYLDNEEVIAEYLAAALEDPNPDVFLHAVGDVARARGISKVARDAGLGRESLYKALAPGAKIRYDTVRKLMDSLGVRLNNNVRLRASCVPVWRVRASSEVTAAAGDPAPGS
jgi:probable addiction module antidote protein